MSPRKEYESGIEARKRILAYLRKYIAEHGYSPNVREIMDACDLCSTSLVSHHLIRLRDAGAITYDDKLSRTVRIVEREAEIG
jgi:SOS-response transcriptional repressor LexA